MTAASPIIKIENLSLSYRTHRGPLAALSNIDLEIIQGETLGLVGESGSGKTSLALALLNYLPGNGAIQGGRILYQDRDILQLDEGGMRKVWGSGISFVPQNPFSSLNPSMTIGAQLGEVIRREKGISQRAVLARVKAMMQSIRVEDAERVMKSYPHEISGGQQQRILIAMALASNPDVLVLDEPTTGLDVTTEASILDLIQALIHDAGKSALYISHNLGVVSRISDRVAVLYASELVETGPTAELFQRPVHPYTQGLIRSIPQFGQRKTIQALQGIPGEMVKPGSRPQGCLFASRCELATEKCQLVRPEIEQVGGGQTVRCHYWQDIVSGRLRLSSPSRSMKNTAIKDRKELLSVNGLEIDYGFRGILGSEGKGRKRAVNHVGLVLSKGEILGIVGESGSGKTSLARAVIGLVERSGGDIRLHGLNLPTGLQGRRRDQLKSIQMIYQNPEDALNPHLTVGEILARPLIRLLDMNEKSASERVGELLLMVNLPPDFSARRPGELSGGEKQRVALARAFAANPDLVLADEPVSALDVSIRAGILDLISKIQAEKGTSVIFISHDLSVVAYLADQVAVMYLGQIVEFTGNEELLSTPHHPYTEALLSLAPGIGPGESQTGVRIEGEIPLGVDMLKGCPFYSRCPRVLGEVCRVESPPWRTTPDGKRILCHIPLEDPLQVQGFTMPSVTEDR